MHIKNRARHDAYYHLKGFTLIEMLVIIAILGILASLMMPQLRNAFESGRQIKCLNNMRQVGLLLRLYMADNKGYQPKSYLMISETPRICHRWYQSLNPYIGLPIPQSSPDADSEIFHCDVLPGQTGMERSGADYTLTDYNGYSCYNDWIRPAKAKSPSRTAQFYDGAVFLKWTWAGNDYYQVMLNGNFKTRFSEDRRATDWRHNASIFGPSYNNSLNKGYNGMCNFSFLDGHAESFNNSLSPDQVDDMHELQ